MAVVPAVNASSSAEPGSRMTYSRLIGALFLLGFLCYGVRTCDFRNRRL